VKAKRPPAPIPIKMHPDAEEDLTSRLDPRTAADVTALIDDLDGRTHQELVALLDQRSERKLCQLEKSHPEGTLRILFAWGKACLWFIGAFVKHNNPEGERFMRRIRPRAEQVKKLGVND
jgi:hypothetical protein